MLYTGPPMFGLGFGEIFIILVLALVLLGPQKLPEVAKQLGKAMRDFKKASDGLKEQFEKEFYADDAKPRRPAPTPQVPTASAPVPSGPAKPVPLASAENVPGLDVALFDPPPVAATPAPVPAPQPASAPEFAASPAPPATPSA